MKTHSRNATGRALAAAILAALGPSLALAGTSTNTSGPVQQGQTGGTNNPAVTISFSGQTALRAFNTSAAISELSPGGSITIHDGTADAPVVYEAPAGNNTFVQLANPAFNTPDVNPGTPSSPSDSTIQVASALRLEWHEQGSAQGLVDLVNDQVGYNQTAGPLSSNTQRGPSSSNPTWVNTNKFTSSGSTSINGFALNGAVTDPANTYDPTLYNLATGQNLQQGQNRIQFSIGEYKTEDLSVSGANGALAATPGSAGYGKGNPALPAASTAGLGAAGSREAFDDSSVVDEATNIVDPQSTTSQTYGQEYGSGPWNTAGADNINSTQIAVTAVGITANPGTGLQRLDLTDTQWLQTTGRLQNGAEFNFVTRDINAGQRSVFALSTGVDPSWATGVNDGGNSTNSTTATAQHSIGNQLHFSGKTSGSEAEATISQSRFSLGVLSLSDTTSAKNNAPIRALDIDFYDSSTDPGESNDSNYVGINFNNIVNVNPTNPTQPAYKAILISNYNTIKTPNASALAAEEAANPSLTAAQAWAQAQTFNPSNPTDPTTTGIKGDNNGDVAAFISNIANSIGSANAGLTTGSLTNANDPADGLYANGFLTPGLLNYTQTVAGTAVGTHTLTAGEAQTQSNVSSLYSNLFTPDNPTNPYGSSTETIGSSAVYASLDNQATLNGTIAITATNSSGTPLTDGTITPYGNYLVGNFNQNGIRDYSAVQQAVNALVSLHHADGALDSIFTADGGVTNSTLIPNLGTGSFAGSGAGWATTADTKGDLIVLGDINGDGKFNGEDLYLLATGASLSANLGTTSLGGTDTTFADTVRASTDVLQKNNALDYVNTYLNNLPSAESADAAFIRSTARAVINVGTTSLIPANADNLGADPNGGVDYTWDQNGLNAFNKSDTNRDGLINANDALVTDKFIGDDKTNLTESLAATINENGTTDPTPSQQLSISLWQVGQVDGSNVIGQADLNVVNTALTGPSEELWTGNELKSGSGSIVIAHSAGTNSLPNVPLVTVNSGAALTVANGTFNAGGAVDIFTDSNSGAQLPVVNNASFVVSGGSQHPKTIDGTGTTTVTGGTLTTAYIRQGALDITGGTAVIAEGSGAGSLGAIHAPTSGTLGTGSVSSLAISGSGQLDLTTHALVINYGNGASPVGELNFSHQTQSYPANSISRYIQTAYDGGNWDTPGLTSSVAANDFTGTTAVGVVDENDLYSLEGTDYTTAHGGPGTWEGQPVSNDNNVLVRYTYYGDTNLDGTVDATDVDNLIQGFEGFGNGWLYGDFNYDGTVNGQDVTELIIGFSGQKNPMGDGGISAGQAQFLLSLESGLTSAQIQKFESIVGVPEPTSLGLLGAATLGLLGRRRRRS